MQHWIQSSSTASDGFHLLYSAWQLKSTKYHRFWGAWFGVDEECRNAVSIWHRSAVYLYNKYWRTCNPGFKAQLHQKNILDCVELDCGLINAESNSTVCGSLQLVCGVGLDSQLSHIEISTCSTVDGNYRVQATKYHIYGLWGLELGLVIEAYHVSPKVRS